MKKVYMFNDAIAMIYLAREVQTKIYWHNHFYIDNESLDYDKFWDLCIHAISEGCTAVEIDEATEDIRFFQ